MLLGDCLANGVLPKTVEFTPSHVHWYRAQLCLSTAAFHFLLGIIHALSTADVSVMNRRKRYCTRFAASVLLIGVSFSEWNAVNHHLTANINTIDVSELAGGCAFVHRTIGFGGSCD